MIQHPSEVGRSKGTLRILERCLAHLDVVIGESPEQLGQGGLTLPDTGVGVLFPGPDSQPLEQAPAGSIRHWLVLDGTWRKAARILHLNPQLAALPRFHFAQPPTSRYVIRKAPADHHLSTAEATAHLLALVEPGLDVSAIDSAMAALVQKQLAQIPSHLHGRYRQSDPG